MAEETIVSASDIEAMLKPYDAVDEGIRRYPVCQSSAFRGLIIARAAQAVAATERAKAALETPQQEGVSVNCADLKRLIGVQDDIYAAEKAYDYTVDGYRLFRNQATNIWKARNNVNAVEALKQALALYMVSKPQETEKRTQAPKGKKR